MYFVFSPAISQSSSCSRQPTETKTSLRSKVFIWESKNYNSGRKDSGRNLNSVPLGSKSQGLLKAKKGGYITKNFNWSWRQTASLG